MANALNNITFQVFAERVKRRIFNGYPSIAENTTNNEIYLYFYEACGVAITRMSNSNLQVEGVRSIPEGFLTTYKFSTFTKDYARGWYSVTLQQPPVNLPLGYSIVSPYFGNAGFVGYPLIAVHPFQRGYYSKLPTPNFGGYYFVENNIFYVDTVGADINSVGSLYVPMLSPRTATGSDTDTINMPDDAFSMVFDIVVQKLTQRLEIKKDRETDGKPIAHTT